MLQFLQRPGGTVPLLEGARHDEHARPGESPCWWEQTVSGKVAQQDSSRLFEGEDHERGSRFPQFVLQQGSPVDQLALGDFSSAPGRPLNDIGETDPAGKRAIVLVPGALWE